MSNWEEMLVISNPSSDSLNGLAEFAYPLISISLFPSPSRSHSRLCQAPMNNPDVASPAATICSLRPSPSMSAKTMSRGEVCGVKEVVVELTVPSLLNADMSTEPVRVPSEPSGAPGEARNRPTVPSPS